MAAHRKPAKMADPSVGWCGRLSPCLRVQPWPPAVAGEPAEPPLLPEPDPGFERLLALCSGGTEPLLDDDADASQSSSASEEILSNQDLTLDKAMIARDLLGECDPAADGDGEPAAKRLCRALPGSAEPTAAPPLPPPPPAPAPPPPEEPPEELSWRKPVNLGAEHQALLPPLRSPAGRRRARPAGDRLLWDPSRLVEHEVERYQRRLRPSVVSATAAAAATTAAAHGGTHVPDHEQALLQLQECGHSVEEALRRVTPDQLHPPGRLSHWSDGECDLFEQGLRLYGKDFHTIQRQKVRTRSVGEIVHFYYLWKKTERHRQFLSLTQRDKRKYGPDTSASDPASRVLSAASSLQILMTADPWEHGSWAAGAEPTDLRLLPPLPPPPGLASLLASCPQLLLP